MINEPDVASWARAADSAAQAQHHVFPQGGDLAAPAA